MYINQERRLTPQNDRFLEKMLRRIPYLTESQKQALETIAWGYIHENRYMQNRTLVRTDRQVTV